MGRNDVQLSNYLLRPHRDRKNQRRMRNNVRFHHNKSYFLSFYYVCGTGSAQDSVSGSGMNAAKGSASFTPPALNYNNATGSISIVPGKLTVQAWLNGYGSGPSTTTEVLIDVYLIK